MKLAICASASFYTEVIDYSYKLEAAGFEAVLPKMAADMKLNGRANEEATIDWSTNPEGYGAKSVMIREHFEEIKKCDAVLVMNYEKHGKQNYIGPNVLMEMSTAFYLRKPIYVLNGIPKDSPLLDEIMGLEPVFLDGDITKIKASTGINEQL